ncbi:hypothetical protein P3T76_006812 [Phytophthora citrophthora]|uniref:WW domain-containing protein n=1 Tax=Phytophthora citrophthora TaxID=4793 RepID=A0AAD9GP75_9STRA|nr:hypothetical protein P3T76_006812 [Phytophthora citrophthora]
MVEDSPSSFNVAAASILSQFNTGALRRDFERLSVDDLAALASFPVEPHELIGRVVAVTHCLLLSLAPEHTNLELRAPPWKLLRLQLLENTTKVWRKLRKRACQLESGIKKLPTVQISFGLEQLLPFVQPQKEIHLESWQLERVAQVSTIAASLGAWAVFCLCCSVLPKKSRHRLVKDVVVQPLSSVKLSLQAQRQQDPDKSATEKDTNYVGFVKLEPIPVLKSSIWSSRRIGLKIGGRFLLYHVRFPVYSNSRLDIHPPVHPLGECSVYCLDINRIGRTREKLESSWWKPPHTIDETDSQLALCQFTPFAQLSLLVQLGFYRKMFDRPMQEIPHSKTQRSSPIFTLKFDVITVESSQFSTQSIGNIWTTFDTTVAEFRTQVSSFVSKRLNFHFMYRGSILPVSQEKSLPAVALLPFAVLIVASNHKELRGGNSSSQLWEHHFDITQCLVNSGLPDCIQQAPGVQISGPNTPQIYPMSQILAGPSATSVAVEVLTHWHAFVHFRQLQDASVLFQITQRSPKKTLKSPRKQLKHLPRKEDGESVPYGPQPQPLPQKKFNGKKEWLLPLYALADVISPTTAELKTPFLQHVEHSLRSSHRLVLGDEANVVHSTSVTTNVDTLSITFLRDESCSLESLLELKSVYIWLVMPRKPHNTREASTVPTEWLIDLYRFVQHPIYDFPCHQTTHFRVGISLSIAERAIESSFWSKNVDWTGSMSSTDLYSTILRQIFTALCRSHPPAFGVDSVKFSKLLYEANIQPKLLSIGDAAFLFASNLTHGFSYEMNFDGFVHAVEWLAQRFYSETGTSPSKNRSGAQHAMTKWKLQRNERNSLITLRRLCFESLVHLPMLTTTWQEIMNSWRLARKQLLLDEYALHHCAATRIRATWVGFRTWRVYVQRRQRMKAERLAATKLQSVARGRRLYVEYQRVRQILIRTQLQIRAKFELRRLRAERKAFVERMRLRIVRWTRCHLWRLREWKRVNAVKAARRNRIREKKLRRLGVAVFPLETRRVRCSLYRAEPNETENDQGDETYELEVLDSDRSWGLIIGVSQQKIGQFIVEETQRQALQIQLGFAIEKQPQTLDQLSRGWKQEKTGIMRDSVAQPELEPNIFLLALARRLIGDHIPGGLHFHVDPVITSLGKLVFKGAIRSQRNDQEDKTIQLHVIRVLEWAGTFKFIMYTPSTSSRSRYDLDASFIFTVLQFSHFQSMNLAPEEQKKDQENTFHTIRRTLNGPHKLLALRCILTYVLKHGVKSPTYDMLPHVIAERQRQRDEIESKQREALLVREQQLVLKVQTRMRQRFAKKTRLQLALALYSKQLDRESGQFVYVLRLQSGEQIMLGERKPWSLFTEDVPLPPDAWVFISDAQFFNPRRGVYSRFNDSLAAATIQRWYRGKIWNGINTWSLSDLANALRYHQPIEKPANLNDSGQLENLKRYALHLHVLEHQYKAAYPIYEAALKLSPDDPQALVGFATLLAISCRYPAAQSWQRALAFLQKARELAKSTTLDTLEQNWFRWALFLQPKSPHAIVNYAVYLQFVHLDIDKAELLYRRALDLDPADDLIITNFQRLQSERAPGRMYAFAGPGTIVLARSVELSRCGLELEWREMEDPTVQKRFFHNLRTGKCVWELPTDTRDS